MDRLWRGSLTLNIGLIEMGDSGCLHSREHLNDTLNRQGAKIAKLIDC